jgi:heme/copper-type cytochrome/quinol oxidase subunit 1
VSTVGAVLTALSILPFVWNVAVSLRKGKVAGDDPGRQWPRMGDHLTSTPSQLPPPA